MSFIEAFTKLGTRLFRLPFSMNLAKIVVRTFLLLKMASRHLSLPQTNSLFPLRLSESLGMFNCGQIYQTVEGEIRKLSLPSVRSLIKHAASVNHSA